MSCKFILCVILIFCLSILCTVFLLFYIHLSALTSNFSPKRLTYTLCVQNICLLIMAKIFRDYLGLTCLITEAFVLHAVPAVLNILLHVHSSKASSFLLSAFHGFHIHTALLGWHQFNFCVHRHSRVFHNFCQCCFDQAYLIFGITITVHGSP